MDPLSEIFSFHLMTLPWWRALWFVFRGARKAAGLKHAESFHTMNLGEPIAGRSRYRLGNVAVFAWWSDEKALETYLAQSSELSSGWHVRLKLYRRWGEVADLQAAHVSPELATPTKPVVAVTLAHLKLTELFRFIKWGHPVERQVRDHRGQTLALAAIRPPGTFSTFSIWKNESEMLEMVRTRSQAHNQAMQERTRRDFHHEFTTLRFIPLSEHGIWNSKTNFTLASP